MTNDSRQPSPDVNPELIFETLNAFQRCAALQGAIELDVFTAVAQGQADAASLARALRADPRAVRILCDYLVVLGLLTKQGEHYGLTPTSATFLDRRSPQYLGSIAHFLTSPTMRDAFRDVAELVRRGRTLLDGDGTVEREFEGWIEFARSMAPLMMPAAQFMAQVACERLAGPIRVLDIAAGHGMFGICLAQRHPQASIVALDWPQVLEIARQNARQAGVEDRYSLLPGDALRLDYGRGYDLVLVTNFLHHFDPPTCISIMRKVASAIEPGGLAMTLEFVPNADRVSPPLPAAFALTMLATTPSGDAYTFEELAAMWREAGLGESECMDVPHSPQRLVLSRRGA